MLIQQGDVLIKSAKEIKGKKLNHLTLAVGVALLVALLVTLN